MRNKLNILIPFVLLFFTNTLSSSELNQLILAGAKNEIKNKTKYNPKMLKEYVPTNYKDGKRYTRNIYPNGDVNPKEGVCTDLIIRACRNANIDLQKLVHEDVLDNKKYYGIKIPDKFIDHRRVWVLLRFFKRNYKSLPVELDERNEHWKPGDIVVWDIGSKEHLHIGIISDNRTRQKRPYVIHNMRFIPSIFPGRTCEQDVLLGVTKLGIRFRTWKILGHFSLSQPIYSLARPR